MTRFKCCKCEESFPSRKGLKKLNEGYFCKGCHKEKRANHREYLKRDVLGIKKREELEKEWEEKRRAKAMEKPKIFTPGIKSIKKKPRISSLGMYITKEEKKERYLSFIRMGMSSDEANKRIKNICEKMSELKAELKNEVNSKEELNKRFKESFEELCMEYQ